MPQVHYTDIDEEITSLVDRLRKSKSQDNFFVVPQRSMVFQSLVNLKLFKREAQKMRKKIALVTQNDFILSLAKKVEIETKNGIDGAQFSKQSNAKINEAAVKPKMEIPEKEESEIDKKARLENIGTSNFYGATSVEHIAAEPQKKPLVKPQKASQISQHLSAANKIQQNSLMNDMLPAKKNEMPKTDIFQSKENEEMAIDAGKQKKVEYFFSKKTEPAQLPNSATVAKKENILPAKKEEKRFTGEKIKVPGRFKKVIFLFALVCVVLFAVVAAYLFLPKAEVRIFPNIKKGSADFEIHNYQDGEKSGFRVDSAKIIEVQETRKESFDATGRTGVANKKAKGKVVIFNEFSASPQPLVATTRLLSEGGRLFRLDKGVTVPGMSKLGAEMKPGAIEASVTADESGEEYNIEPSRFTIPGFEGSEKYDKFYAKSEKSMSGGGFDETASKSVSQADIDNARENLEKKLKEDMKKMLDEKTEEGNIQITGSESFATIESQSSAKAADLKEVFDYTLTLKVSVYTVNVKELEQISQEYLKSRNHDLDDLQLAKIDYEIRQPEINQENMKLTAKIHVEAAFQPLIDIDAFRKSILGKNEQEISEIALNNGKISGFEIAYWPSFMTSKLPQYESRVKVVLVDPITIPQ